MLTATLQSLGYLPVSTATLHPDVQLDFDLYIQHPGRNFAELFRDQTCPLKSADLERLAQARIDHLYIRLEDSESYRQYLSARFLHDAQVPAARRLMALREVTRVAFDDALRASDFNHLVSLASGFGQDLAGMLADQTPAFEELFKTLDHDFYTFTHACNVSTYCTVIAIRLNLCDSVELAELAAGALLHDIGKRHIPLTILNKSGTLTDQEWAVIRQHPLTGYQELAGRGDFNTGQLMMVYQHHERLDGSGYPVGLMAEEIHPWAKICAVADVFDAMSCRRPYRRALPIPEVCAYLRKQAGLRYDFDAVACWTAEIAGEQETPSEPTAQTAASLAG
jgi:HD-GYP domain-containing protein (c-di-GMP phosphodiesterase class II)